MRRPKTVAAVLMMTVPALLFPQTKIDYATQVRGGPVIIDITYATLQLACDAAATAHASLNITKFWPNVPTTTCNAVVNFVGTSARIEPATAAVFFMNGYTAVDRQVVWLVDTTGVVRLTGQAWGTPIAAGNFSTLASACDTAVVGSAVLIVNTPIVSSLAVNTTCAANIQANKGGILTPAAGVTLTLTGTFNGDLTQHFDTSASGSVITTALPFKMTTLYPQYWGATANGRTVTDGSCSASGHTLTSATAAFTDSDVGRYVSISGAGAATTFPVSYNGGLGTTISAVTNSTTVTVTAACVATVSGQTVTIGTNDFTALRNTAGSSSWVGVGSVVFPEGMYVIGQHKTLGGSCVDPVGDIHWVGLDGISISGYGATIYIDGSFSQVAGCAGDKSDSNAITPFYLDGFSNSVIQGFDIIANKNLTTRTNAVTGEGLTSFCATVGSNVVNSNYTMQDMSCTQPQTDCYFFGQNHSVQDVNGTGTNLTCTEPGRGNFSIADIDGVSLHGVHASNACLGNYGGYQPCHGVDVEPDALSSPTDNVVIDGGSTFTNDKGWELSCINPLTVDHVTVKDSIFTWNNAAKQQGYGCAARHVVTDNNTFNVGITASANNVLAAQYDGWATAHNYGIGQQIQDRNGRIQAVTACATAPESISSATNANPVVLTTAIAPSSGSVALSGFTGGWVSLNGTFAATHISGTTFSVPVNSSGFGALAGVPVISACFSGGAYPVFAESGNGTTVDNQATWTEGGPGISLQAFTHNVFNDTTGVISGMAVFDSGFQPAGSNPIPDISTNTFNLHGLSINTRSVASFTGNHIVHNKIGTEAGTVVIVDLGGSRSVVGNTYITNVPTASATVEVIYDEGGWTIPVISDEQYLPSNLTVLCGSCSSSTSGAVLLVNSNTSAFPNLIINGSFAGTGSPWTFGTHWALGSGVATATNADGGDQVSQTISGIVSGLAYYLQYTSSGYSGTGTIITTAGGGVQAGGHTGNGTFVDRFVAAVDGAQGIGIAIVAGATNVSITNVQLYTGPPPAIPLSVFTSCGTSASCATKTVLPMKNIGGTIAFSAATTATITAMTAFSGTQTYTCYASDPSNTYTVAIQNLSSTSFRITSGTSNSDTWNWACQGY